MLRQFGFNQGTGNSTWKLATSSALVAKARFIGQEKHQILAGMDRSSGLGQPAPKVAKGHVLPEKVYQGDE